MKGDIPEAVLRVLAKARAVYTHERREKHRQKDPYSVTRVVPIETVRARQNARRG